MLRYRTMQLSGWGNVPRHVSKVFRPERTAEARAVVTESDASLIPRGLGRSYGDAALNDGGAVLLDTRLSRVIDLDVNKRIVECEAGVSLAELTSLLLKRGLFLPVTPGTQQVTIGGAIAADVHGKNHHQVGSFGRFVESFDLLLGSGEVISCSSDRHGDVFWATIGGMGLTGVVLQARFRVKSIESAYLTVDYLKTKDLDEALVALVEGDAQYEYSVAWIDTLASGSSLGRAIVMRGNHAPLVELPRELQATAFDPPVRRRRSVPIYLPGIVLSLPSMRVFNGYYYHHHEDGRCLVSYDEFFYPLDMIGHWNRVYGRRGFFQYQLVLPNGCARQCIQEVIESLVNGGQAPFLAVIKTMGLSSGGLLSFSAPGVSLAVDVPNRGANTADLLRQLDALVVMHGGRVYLAKDACMTDESFRAMYSNLPRFNAIKSAVDPQNRFSSSMSRRLGIGSNA